MSSSEDMDHLGNNRNIWIERILEGVCVCMHGWMRVVACGSKRCWSSGICLTLKQSIYLISWFKWRILNVHESKMKKWWDFGQVLRLWICKSRIYIYIYIEREIFRGDTRRCTNTHTHKHAHTHWIPSPAADPQSLFPSPRENNREKEENVQFFYWENNPS